MEPGEYLYRNGQKSGQLIRSAILCQLYILEKLLQKEEAVSAMRLVSESDCAIEDALDKVGWPRDYYENIRQLRDLLLESGLITDKQKTLAYATCFPFQLPFLSALVQRQALNEETADYALAVQYMILKENLPIEEAIDLLGRCKRPDGTVAKPESAKKPPARQLKIPQGRLGELLVGSTICTHIQVIAAVEEGRRRGKLVGEMLVEHGSLSEADLKRALNARGRVQSGSLTVAEAIAKLDPKRFIAPY